MKQTLDIQNGGRSFGNQILFANFNLQIKQGEFVAILGASGAGKTSLLRLLAGLDNWTQGKFTAPESLSSAFVFQEPNLLSWRTILENTLIPLELTHRSLDSNLAKQKLESVFLQAAQNLYPHQLSGGMKMRASIARALITNPQWLFMDEPFAALDEPTREELQEQLRSIWETDKPTVLFVTHSLTEAVFLANRILFLDGHSKKIKADLTLELPSVRNAHLRTTNEYFIELNRVRHLFSQLEVKRA